MSLKLIQKKIIPFIVLALIFGYPELIISQNTPCNAVSLSSNMTAFQTYNTNGLSNSGVEDPPCGGSPGSDIWFEVTVSATGYLNIVTLAGTMGDAAMAIYSGTCNNLQEFACTESDNCGNSVMPIWDWNYLAPGTTFFIRVWAETGSNGSFDIQITDSPVAAATLNLQTVGSAFSTGPDCVQLTNNSTSQTGCAWDPTQADFSQPFSNNVVINFGNNNGGADGATMTYQNDPAGLAACGVNGGQIAAGGIQNSFIIEFDTWDNGAGANDIPNDHISININGDMNNPINGPFDVGNIEDGVDHEVLFTWDPVTMLYEVYFDGALTLSGNYDIVNNCFGGVTSVWCGFTGSTGGATNIQTVCAPPVTNYPSGDQSVVEAEICEGGSYFAGGGNQTTSGTYSDTYPAYNGCDSIITTILTVTANVQTNLSVAICEGDSYFVGGGNQTTSGTYIDTYTGANGCDSIVSTVLSVNDLIENDISETICEGDSYFAGGDFQTTSGNYTDTYSSPGGCDSIVNTILTVIPIVPTELNESICEGESFFVGGDFQITNGTYTDTYTTPSGCDSIVNTMLTVNPNVQTNLNESICEGESFFVGGDFQTISGSYSDTFTAFNGCDSVVFTQLTVNPNVQTDLVEAICEGGSFFVGGGFQTTSGTYSDSYQTSNGCDSIVITQLTVNPNLQTDLNESICEGESFFVGGDFQTISGTYSDSYFTSNGCDSVVITLLTVNPNVQTDLNEVICEGESFFVGGDFQTISGTYSDSYTAFNGCDSVVVTQLIVNPIAQTAISIAICEGDGYFLGGDFQTTSGIYSDTYTAFNGCDSIVNTQLIVNPNVITILNETICEGDCYFIGGNPFCTPGVHEVVLTSYLNCDSTIQLNLTIANPFATIEPVQLITCDNPNVLLNGSNSSAGPDITYLWTGSDLNCFSGDINSPVVSVNCPDIYTLVVFQEIGGQQCITQQEVVVQEYTVPPTAIINPVTELNCSSPCTELDASLSDNGAPFVPAWTNQNGFVSDELNPTVCDPGTYLLTITNEDNGCTDTASIILTLGTEAAFADAGPDALLDCQNESVILDGSTSTQGTDFILQWEDPNNSIIGDTPTIEVSTPGIYWLTVLNEMNGCISIDSVNVTVDIEPPIADIATPEILNCANTSITLDGSGSGASNDYTFSWQSPLGTEIGNTALQEINIEGSYFLVIINTINNCTDTTSTTVLENIISPMAEAGIDQDIDCNTPFATFDGSNSNANGNISFQWLNDMGVEIGSDTTLQGIIPGPYTLVITDLENNCMDTDSVVLYSASVYPVANAGVDTIINCSNPIIDLSALGSDTGSDFEYEWQNENGEPIGSAFELETDSSGTFTLMVLNTENGCSSLDEVTVNENFIPPFADAGMNQVLDCVSNNVILDGSNSQQGPDITYNWAAGNGISLGTEITFEANSADIYTLVVTDENNGCSSNSTVDVSLETDAPISDAGEDLVINCNQPLVTLDGSNSSSGPNITSAWSNEAGDPLGNSLQLQTGTPGIYNLSIHNTLNGCTTLSNTIVSIDTITPVVPETPVFILNCYAPTTLLGTPLETNNPDWTFTWEDENANTLATTDTLTVTFGGSFILSVLNNSNGCETVVNTSVTENFTIPVSDAGNNATLDCITSTLTLDGSNSSQGLNISYLWEDGNNTPIGTESTIQVTEADTYTLFVSDEENGCSSNSSVEISQEIDAPTADAGDNLILNCSETSVTLDGSNSTSGPNIDVLWTNEAGNPVGNTIQVSTTLPGIYNLSVTNTLNGCISLSDAVVGIDTIAPNIIPPQDIVLNCYSPTNTLGASIGLNNPDWTFEWENESGSSIATSDTLDIIYEGIYTLNVTNSTNSCNTIVSTQVTEDFSIPFTDAGPDSILTCETPEIILDGGNSDNGVNFLMEWQNSSNEVLNQAATVFVNEPDNYALFVTDLSNGCIGVDEIMIAIDTLAPVVDSGPGDTLTCETTAVVLDGSNSTYEINAAFSWTDGSNTEIGSNLTQVVNLPGIYNLSITNLDNGCETSNNVIISENTILPIAEAGSDIVLNCFSPSAILDATASSNGTSFTYEWQDEQNLPLGDQTTLPVSSGQEYTLIITNTENGCTSSDQVMVTENFELPVSDAGPDITLDCQTVTSFLGGPTTSAGANFIYQWNNSLGQNIGMEVNQLIEDQGNFQLIVLDNINGCADTSSVEVSIDQEIPYVTGTVDELLTCLQLTATLNATGTSATPEMNYNWSTISGGTIFSGADNLTPYVELPGQYQLIATNTINHCADTLILGVIQDIVNPVANAGLDFELDCHDPVNTLNGNLSSPTGILEYNWSTTNGQFESPVHIAQPTISFPGEYLLTVINTQNGCEDSDQVQISSNFITSIAIETEDPLCHDQNGSIVIPEVDGGNPPFLYSIDGGENFFQSNVFPNVSPGQYQVIILDSNDCTLEESSQIIAPAEVLVMLNTEPGILLGDSYQLQAITNLTTDQIDTIIWSPVESLSCQNCLTPLATPLTTTEYNVQIIDVNGCAAEASQRIIVDRRPNVFVPNAFSPNGDGNNDVFMIFSNFNSVYKVNTFQIFNRWGETVFEVYDFPTNTAAYGWNGYYNGKLANPAVFVWYAEVEFIDGSVKLFKGNVTLMR
jgi:gliding motility-associated-like protein